MSERVVCCCCRRIVPIEYAMPVREGMFYGPGTYVYIRCLTPPKDGGTPRDAAAEGGVRR